MVELILVQGDPKLMRVECQRIILLECQWEWDPIEQLWKRIHRIGQERQTFCYLLLMKETIEEKIFRMSMRKAILANLILYNKTPFVGRFLYSELQEFLCEPADELLTCSELVRKAKWEAVNFNSM